MEIKNNLQGKNSSVDKAEIKSIIWNIRKQKTIRTTRKKRNQRNKDSVSSLWENFKMSNTRIMGC